MKFVPASKKRAKLRLALSGLAGGGKTWTALAIAQHLVDGGKVAVIDTERGSASLYANKFRFDVLELEKHSPSDYIAAIDLAASAGYDVIVIDSFSHAWIDSLERVDQTVERGGSNNFTAWRKVSPAHNKLVDTILSCPSHVIATMRSKVEYALQDNEKGKKEIKKLGLAPVQRSGVDYEFTIVGDLDLEHRMLISKSRADAIPVGEIVERPGEVFAKRLRTWLDDGTEPTAQEQPTNLPTGAGTPAPSLLPTPANGLSKAFESYLAAMKAAADLASLERAAVGPAKPVKGTPEHKVATDVYLSCHADLTRKAKVAGAS